MTNRGFITANLLNGLILELDNLVKGEDIYLSLEEFALGQPKQIRSIDLCWGYSSVEPSTSELAKKELVLGYGVTRNSTGELDKVNYSFSSNDLTTLLPSNQDFENIYAFGSIFMTPSATLGNNPTIEPVILKGTSSGSPLLMTRDIDLNTIKKMIETDEVNSAIKPESDSMEIFKFLLDIKFYNSTKPQLKNVKIYLFDKRLPRGWGGFADEFMALNLTSNIIYKKEDYTELLDTYQLNIYNIVKSWINLRSWSPSFIDFWTANSNYLPARLKTYLELEFSIII